MGKVTRLPNFLYSYEEVLDWVTKVTRLWNAEFRLSYDAQTHKYVAEIVYSDSSVKNATGDQASFAVNELIDSLGGLDGSTR